MSTTRKLAAAVLLSLSLTGGASAAFAADHFDSASPYGAEFGESLAAINGALGASGTIDSARQSDAPEARGAFGDAIIILAGFEDAR